MLLLKILQWGLMARFGSSPVSLGWLQGHSGLPSASVSPESASWILTNVPPLACTLSPFLTTTVPPDLCITLPSAWNYPPPAPYHPLNFASFTHQISINLSLILGFTFSRKCLLPSQIVSSAPSAAPPHTHFAPVLCVTLCHLLPSNQDLLEGKKSFSFTVNSPIPWCSSARIKEWTNLCIKAGNLWLLYPWNNTCSFIYLRSICWLSTLSLGLCSAVWCPVSEA